MAVSNLQILRTLIAKDWRLFRVPMIALIIVGAGCYLLALAAIADDWRDVRPHERLVATDILSHTSLGALGLTCLLASAVGGIAIAAERTDRTADFLGLLPVTRMQIVLSKLLGSALMLGLFAAIHLTAFLICIMFEPSHVHFTWDSFVLILMWIGFATCLFGVAWLFSTFMASGPISACIAIAVTAVSIAMATYLLVVNHPHHPSDLMLSSTLSAVTFGIGLPSLIGGSLYYRWRVAP